MIYSEYERILSSIFEGIYIVDKNRKIIFWNKGCEEITGYSANEVVNRHCFDNILRHVTEDGTELCFNGCPLHKTLKTGDHMEASVYLHHKDGYRVPVEVRSFPIYDDNDNVIAAVEAFSDLRYKKDVYGENLKLKELITTDELTQIPNRRYINFIVENNFSKFREFGVHFAILFVDIDHFKNVNDTYGHDAGDMVLKVVSNTLVNNVRTGDTVGRWGGEEFIVVLSLDKDEALFKVAEKLRTLVENSYIKIDEKNELNVTISIGGTIITEDDDINDIIKRADTNMYTAKNTGRNKTVIK